MAKKQKPKTYTGDIAKQHIDPAKEYSAGNQEIDFSDEQHAIWEDLFAGIYKPHMLEHICREFKKGVALLCLDSLRRIPTVALLNECITPRTGWKIERTVTRYTQADDWYKKFAKRIFLITDYLRTRNQIEFTPEPDMFHDIFGHLPYLTMKFYADIEDKFAPAYMKATQEEKEVIKRLAWYSTEFGLVIEDNRFKIFGAGILSGRSEFENTIMEFYRLSRDNVIDYTKDIFAQLTDHFTEHKHDIYRIIDGVNELHERGNMSSPEAGWNVMDTLYDKLNIPRRGYFGGGVILAPFDVETIARIPKTVYAFNPIFFVCRNFEHMSYMLDSYLKPITKK